MTTNELLSIADFVRYETILDGQRAAWLDGKKNDIITTTIAIADATKRMQTAKRPEFLTRMIARLDARLNATIGELAEWLKEFKQARPNLPYNI